MGAIVADIIQQRIDRVRNQFSAVLAEPFSRQDFRFQRVFSLQPADDLLGNKTPLTVALEQGNKLGN